MGKLSHYMTDKHRHCDDLFINCENAIQKQNWHYAEAHWPNFVSELETHLQAEEQVLFPQFEAATGMTQGPTAVMRMEHGQIRQLVSQLQQAIVEQDQAAFAGQADALMMLLQQHNMKEEMMLYPMSEQHLSNSEQVATELAEFECD